MAAVKRLIDNDAHIAPTSLYVHIPFCKSRCFYCDFNTYVAPQKVMEQYMEALDTEFSWIEPKVQGPLDTVFVGGGTPTLPPSSLLERMLQSLHAHFSFAPGAEMTFESNPDSIDSEKLNLLRAYGVNRISFGAQSFRDRLLMTIGRAHDAKTAVESVWQAAEAGFTHINVDLMFGLPDQSLDDVQHALTQVLELPVDHVSAYWLKVEEGTPFASWRELGQLPLPGEDLEADMYDLVRRTLTEHGFRHYEISNFAKPGGEARHNLVYWRNQPYIAAGAGAHGYIGGVRYENVRPIPTYLDRVGQSLQPIAETYNISVRERAEDAMMVGLRLAEGVSDRLFTARFGETVEAVFGQVVTALCSQGLLDFDGETYRIPAQYWPVANVIFEKFVTTPLLD